MQNVFKAIYTVVIIAFAIVGVYGTAVLIGVAMDKSEVVDCLKLDQQSDDFRATGVFFITAQENDMCNAHDIHINAPVGEPVQRGE